MDNTIKIGMSKRDAEQAQKIFDKDDDPNFSIISTIDLGEDMVQLEIIFDAGTHLWGLAKRVEMWNTHEDRMKELKSKYAQ